MSRAEPSELADRVEVARMLGVDPGTVDQWRHRGELPDPWARWARATLWLRSEIVRWAGETGREVRHAQPESDGT